MGPDLSNYRRLFPKLRIPLPIVKDISRQLLLGLSYLHDECHVIHTGRYTSSSESQHTPALKGPSRCASALTKPKDIKPQNILIESPAINQMFERAPPEAFRPRGSPLEPPNDFYMVSTQLSSNEEDIAQPAGLSVRLADFGTCKPAGICSDLSA